VRKENMLEWLQPPGNKPDDPDDKPDMKDTTEEVKGFFSVTNPEPYFEGGQNTSKQDFVDRMLRLSSLHNKYAHMDIDWHKCRKIVQKRIRQTMGYMEQNDMEAGRYGTDVHVKEIMKQIVPHTVRKWDRKDEEQIGRASCRERVFTLV
jgi:hypothetical protein